MRLINADELVEILDEEYRKDKSNVWKYLLINLVKQILSDAPTIDAKPIRHGRWIEPNDKGVVSYDKHAYAECSVCHTAEYLARGKRYCPNCGAKMYGGREDVNE